MSFASSSDALTLPVMKVSFERSWKVLRRPDRQFVDDRAHVVDAANDVLDALRRSRFVPTEPVSSTWRLKLVMLTYMLSLAISRMRAPPRSSMPWSSTCAPELRRSVATMPTPTAAAPPTTSGTQAERPATSTAPAVNAIAMR